MPNKKGGKNYKKSKSAEDAPTLYERLEDQMYARVIKVLGNCNLLVYCNDGRERIVHIRGNMRKKVWISVGDIVLISIREYGKESPTEVGRGDVCAKYEHSVIHKLRQKDDTINPKLFEILENDKSSKNIPAEDVFLFEGGESNESEEGDEESEEEDKEARFPNNRLQQRLDDDFNIDDI